MRYLNGLRIRIVGLILGAMAPVALPAIVISIQSQLAHGAQLYRAAAAATESAGERIEAVIVAAKTLSSLAPRLLAAGCGTEPAVSPSLGPFDAAVLIAPNGERCNLTPETADSWLKEGAAARSSRPGDPPARVMLSTDGGPEGRLTVASLIDGFPGALLALRVGEDALTRSLETPDLPILKGLAIYQNGAPVIVRNRAPTPAAWWPRSLGVVGPSKSEHPAPLPHQQGLGTDLLIVPLDATAGLYMVAAPVQNWSATYIRLPWETILPLAILMIAVVAVALWIVDRSVVRWVIYLTRIAILHSRGRHSVRAKSLRGAPIELASLAEALNMMANDAERRTAALQKSSEDSSALLLELHHRVKNILQVISSLLSLVRQETDPGHRAEIRFLEDYLYGMSAAFRLAYDSGDLTGVYVQDLVARVVEALSPLAGAPRGQIELVFEGERTWIDLDMAVSVSLYLAATLPPFFSPLAARPTAKLRLTTSRADDGLVLALDGEMDAVTAAAPPLRTRLQSAYVRQMRAIVRGQAIRIPLGATHHPHRLATLTKAAPKPAFDQVDPHILIAGYELMAAETGLMLTRQDLNLRHEWLSGANLFGRASERPAGPDSLPAPAAAAVRQAQEWALADGEPHALPLRVEQSGEERHFAVNVWPLRDPVRQLVGLLTAYRDVSASRAEEALLEHKLQTMIHRSNNVIAVVESIARQSIAHAASPEDFLAKYSARLRSLASSHDLLMRTGWESGSLRDLVHAQLGAYLLVEPAQIEAIGPNLVLAASAIPYLGLALHELATNAASYGALSVPAGRVTLQWGLRPGPTDEDEIWLSWQESGGPPVPPTPRRGFGAELSVRALTRALRAEVTINYATEGVIWRATAPAARLLGRN